MKKYTHAWLAMMAMKRIEKATIPEAHAYDAIALIKWFKDHRDSVISGAWYPDHVICDMGTSHIVKYTSDENSRDKSFRVMPHTLLMYNEFKKDSRTSKPFTIVQGNLCDRCESLTERIVDSFKALYNEGKGCPICPSGNEIAHIFFMLSHYIADCHMPLHCDSRSFNASSDIHAWIEDQWDKQVSQSYKIDEANERFFYDEEGYPASTGNMTKLMSDVENEAVSREFYWDWKDKDDDKTKEENSYVCKNTWDYMSGISQYSYVMAHRLVPDELGENPKDIKIKVFQKSEAYTKNFDRYSFIIMSDAVESIAKIWLHAWCRYRDWWRGREAVMFKDEADAAEAEYKESQSQLKALEAEISDLEAKLATLTGKNKKTADSELKARKKEYESLLAHVSNLEKFSESARLKAEEKKAEQSKYESKN